MGNLSQKRRAEMLEYLNHLKEIHTDDESRIALGKIETALTEKKYGLVWEEHEEEVDKKLVHNIPVFKEVEERKIVADENADFNFLLEGDNLHSLKLLEKTHKGKIDVIYIDPPYNTGNKDFIYDDNYIGSDDGYRHSKWLSFMNERLVIAQKLLSDVGIIFISIDNNELAQLKLLCDEIFDENNFIQIFKWNKTSTPPSLSLKTREKYEYVLCYEKNRTDIKFNGGFTDGGDVPLLNSGNSVRKLNFKKEDVNFQISGDYKAGKYGKIELLNDIKIKKGKSDRDFSMIGEFKWTQERVDEEVINGTFFLIKSKQFSIRFQRKNKKIKSPSDILTKVENGVDTNEQARKEVNKLVPNNNMSYPKPISLINYLIKFNENNRSNEVILDFFAGSGTTGHAVMQLNKEDGGNRKYILCTNNENNICEKITYQRMKNIQEDLPHNLKYYKTEFIPKLSEDEEILSSKLLDYIKEMVELENMCEIDGNSRRIILSDEDLKIALSEMEEGGALYIPSFILLTNEIKDSIEERKLEIVTIPDYYFTEELREVNEL